MRLHACTQHNGTRSQVLSIDRHMQIMQCTATRTRRSARMASSPPSLLLLLLVILVLVSPCSGVLADMDSGKGTRQLTRIRLYIHETFSGANATVADRVVASPLLGGNATFGEVGVLDDEVRAGEDPASELVGRFQGFFVGTDMRAPRYMSAVSLVFTAGEYNGSTVTVQGQFGSDDGDGALERSVVGGTGRFRMARGYSLMKVVAAPTPESVVFRIDVFVVLMSRRHGHRD